MPTSLSLEQTETNALALAKENGVLNIRHPFLSNRHAKYLLVDQLLSLERSPRSLGSLTVCESKAKRTGVRHGRVLLSLRLVKRNGLSLFHLQFVYLMGIWKD